MELNNLDNKLKELIINCSTSKKQVDILDDTNLETDLGYSSLELIQLIVEIENYFDIEVSDEYIQSNLYIYNNLKSAVIKLTA